MKSRVHVWSEHVGLHGQWIDTWSPKSNTTKEMVLFVEDDIDISPYAYKWLKLVKNKYESLTNLSGFSLKDEDMSKHARKLIGEDSIFMRRHNLPWGFSPLPGVWKSFQDWYHIVRSDKSFHPYVKEDKVHTSWYRANEHLSKNSTRETTMWSQWLHYFTHWHKLLCIFPNARRLSGKKRLGFEFNRREDGIHFSSKRRKHINGTHLIRAWNKKLEKFPKKIKILNYNDRIYKIKDFL